jgi:tetratricopeptide (TPR) repeat protein
VTLGAEGVGLVNDALATFREIGEPRLAALCMSQLGNAADFTGHSEQARGLHREALALLKAQGAERETSVAAGDLAECEFQAGNYEAALELNAEAMAIQRSLGHSTRLAMSLHNRSTYLLRLKRLDEARSLANESLLLSRDTQAEGMFVFSIQTLAGIGAACGKLKAGAQMLGFCDARVIELGILREYTEQQEYDTLISLLRCGLSQAELTAYVEEGSHWTDEQAVAEALRA